MVMPRNNSQHSLVPRLVVTPRTITKPMTTEQMRVRDLQLAECRRITANTHGPVKNCK